MTDEYPPKGNAALKMLRYLQQQKIPLNIPPDILSISEWPHHLIPKEDKCSECPACPLLSPPIIITKCAKIISLTGVITSKSLNTCFNNYTDLL